VRPCTRKPSGFGDPRASHRGARIVSGRPPLQARAKALSEPTPPRAAAGARAASSGPAAHPVVEHGQLRATVQQQRGRAQVAPVQRAVQAGPGARPHAASAAALSGSSSGPGQRQTAPVCPHSAVHGGHAIRAKVTPANAHTRHKAGACGQPSQGRTQPNQCSSRKRCSHCQAQLAQAHQPDSPSCRSTAASTSSRCSTVGRWLRHTWRPGQQGGVTRRLGPRGSAARLTHQP